MATTQNRSNNRQSNKSTTQSAQRRSSKATQGPGRGWHGDSEGHARAGSQSHKNK